MPTPRLKIGFVLDDTIDKPDGVQQYVLALGRWMTMQGHEVHYIVGESHRADLPHLHSVARNIRVTFNGNRLSLPLPVRRKKIRRLLDELQLDVVHVQSPHSPWMSQRVILEAAPTVPVVATFHILPYSWLTTAGMYALAVILRPSLARVDRLFAVTTGAQEFIEKTWHIEAPVLPNTIDLKPFLKAKAYTRYEDSTLTLVYLNRLEPRKGAMHLLKAVCHIRDNRLYEKPFRVVVCGKGSEANQLQRYITEHDLTETVSLAGFVSEEAKTRYLASSDLAIYPSTGGESFGIVLLEGMAASRGAVLAGNNPGYACVMQPHEEQLVSPLDTPEFARTLVRYMTEPKARASARAWQSQEVLRYDVANVGSTLVQTYHRLAADRRGATG